MIVQSYNSLKQITYKLKYLILFQLKYRLFVTNNVMDTLQIHTKEIK
jgi:hypothetical protein